MLAHIGALEPDDKAARLQQLWCPHCLKEEKGATRWPINKAAHYDAVQTAWCLVFGIELGWFIYDRAGYLQWAQAGRDRFYSAVGITENFNGAAREATARAKMTMPIEPQKAAPPAHKGQQLDLFG